jgi:hypothetical protein
MMTGWKRPSLCTEWGSGRKVEAGQWDNEGAGWEQIARPGWGNNPEDYTLHSQHGESLKSTITCSSITASVAALNYVLRCNKRVWANIRIYKKRGVGDSKHNCRYSLSYVRLVTTCFGPRSGPSSRHKMYTYLKAPPNQTLPRINAGYFPSKLSFTPTHLWRWNRYSVPKRRLIKFRRRGNYTEDNILHPHHSHMPTNEDGTDTVFRNVGL